MYYDYYYLAAFRKELAAQMTVHALLQSIGMYFSESLSQVYCLTLHYLRYSVLHYTHYSV